MVTVNVVVLAGTVSADPVERRMPSGDEVTELRLSVPEAGKRLLPLPVAAWHATVGKRALKGIVKTPRGYTAMLLGTDGKSYFVGVGQRLFDGLVTAIDATTVTFRQEVTDPLSTVKSRELKKTLYPSEEARQ